MPAFCSLTCVSNFQAARFLKHKLKLMSKFATVMDFLYNELFFCKHDSVCEIKIEVFRELSKFYSAKQCSYSIWWTCLHCTLSNYVLWLFLENIFDNLLWLLWFNVLETTHLRFELVLLLDITLCLLIDFCFAGYDRTRKGSSQRL